ncbi:MAG TPA: trehalase family glycosidase [Actinocrinis sp.]
MTAQARQAEDLHLVSHQHGMHAVLALQPLSSDGQRLMTRIDATPAKLAWIAESGRIEAAYAGVDTIRLRGTGPSLCIRATARTLTSFSGTYLYRDPVDGAFVFTSYETGRRYRVTVLAGAATVQGDQALGEAERSVTITAPPGSAWEIALEEYQTARDPYSADGTEFETVAATAAAAFHAFADRIAPWRDERTPAAELAAYVLWSATVAPAGFLSRPAVLMSKHWMDKVWSWDHCFNALALAEGEPQLAWHQFCIPFDHQDPQGALPDSVAHSEVLYNFVKPPIHGWALDRLLPALEAALEPGDVEVVFDQLARWCGYWLSRRAPGSLLPHYHHGNDSGWDNATTFLAARLVESADAAAFLVLQMRQLAAMAQRLGRTDAADYWREVAQAVQTAMIKQLWTGERFAAREIATGALHPSESLLDTMPIVLGPDLPPDIHIALARQIETHLSEHGPATERPGSRHYDADGYWRGPIWAPSTLLIEDGLRRAGHTGLADEISRRFRALCEAGGFAENFDAVSGAGQRDRAYTWTASSYLLLARDAVRRASSPRR